MSGLKDLTQWNVKDEDAAAYLDVCRRAATDDAVFATFKQNPAYTKILEHCNGTIAFEYYREIIKRDPFLINKKTLSNDKIGSPVIYRFFAGAGYYECSCSTMQYIGVLNRLIQHFGPLDGMSIIEVGGGYGGQALTILETFKVYDYYIYDLPEPGMLQKRYLGKYNNVCMLDSVYARQSKYDLFISNYSLSELSEALQTQYIVMVAAKCKHGYITCNSELHREDLLPLHKRVPDIKGERETNFILIW